MLVGIVLHETVLIRIYSLSGGSDMQIQLPTVEHVEKIMRSAMKLFGFRTQQLSFSIEGLAAVLGFTVLLLTACGILSRLFRRNRIEDENLRLAGWVFVATALVLAGIMLLTGKDEARYLLPAMGFFPLEIAVISEHAFRKKHCLQKILVGIMVVCCVINAAVLMDYFIDGHCGETVRTDDVIAYDGIEVSEIDIVRDMTPVAVFLQHSDYQYGYTAFWRGNILTEMTDGDVEMVIFSPEGYRFPTIYNWLSRRDLFEKAKKEEHVFLLMETWDYEKALVAGAAWLPQGNPVYQDKQFMVFDLPGGNALARILEN